jgi:nucleoside-diphosphate-sugar epimerase
MKEICVKGSAELFRAAEKARVKRIVFISSISAFEGCRSAYGQTKLAVEKMLHGNGNVVLRLGLVFGRKQGGMLGRIRDQVRSGRVLPLIGRGLNPQYLLHEQTLSTVLQRASYGDFDHLHGAPITLAHRQPLPFCDLVKQLARNERRELTLVPIPAAILYGVARAGEAIGFDLPFRSDSIRSFVHCDRNPDFRAMETLGIEPIPYS